MAEPLKHSIHTRSSRQQRAQVRRAVLVIAGVLFLFVLIGWVRFNVNPLWDGWSDWHRAGAPLDQLESLTGGVELPGAADGAPPPKPCTRRPPMSTPPNFLEVLSAGQVRLMVLWHEGCEALRYFVPQAAGDVRYPARGLFALWLHALLGTAVGEGWLPEDAQLDDIPELSRISDQLGLRTDGLNLAGAPDALVRELIDAASWGGSVRQHIADLDEVQRRGLAVQFWLQVLQHHYGARLEELLQQRLRTPLGISERAVLGYDETGMPLAFCCYYASPSEFGALGNLYLSGTGLGAPAGWLDRLGGWRRLPDG
ncbi:MAG: hypothetical protein ISN29_07700, partial [Gammaproteobacteria bacterium AqS3]|nr:hypothetical protein [Gammaproteobacteria bacterium AqS3]